MRWLALVTLFLLGASCERQPVFVTAESCLIGCSLEVETAMGWVFWTTVKGGDCFSVPDWFSVRVCDNEQCVVPGACGEPPQCVTTLEL